MVSACAQITAGTLCRDLVVVAETMDSEATPQATSKCMHAIRVQLCLWL